MQEVNAEMDFWPMDSNGIWRCCVCSAPMPGHEPPTCCGGHECGCMGKPTEPNVCSKTCWETLTNDDA